MAELIPASWRRAVSHLRQDLHDLLDRWWYRHDAGGHIEVRRERPVFGVDGPMIDMQETNDAIMVVAELPGLEKDDFRVDLSGNWLRIRGEKKRASQTKERGYTYAECYYGSFARAFRLPCDIEADKASATYRNGVLRLTLPKTADARARRVRVPVRG